MRGFGERGKNQREAKKLKKKKNSKINEFA